MSNQAQDTPQHPILRGVRRVGLFAGLLLAIGYAIFLFYSLPRTVLVQVTGTEVVRRDAKQPDGTVRVNDVNYITAEDLDGNPRIFRNIDTGWGWPPYFKFDSGDMLAQANNLARDVPPSVALLRYYGFRVQLLSMVPNATSMRIVEAGYRHIPVFNIAVGVAHLVAIIWIAIRVRRWRRGSSPVDDQKPLVST